LFVKKPHSLGNPYCKKSSTTWNAEKTIVKQKHPAVLSDDGVCWISEPSNSREDFFHQTKHGQVMGEQNWKKPQVAIPNWMRMRPSSLFSLDDILEACNTKIPVDVAVAKPKLLKGELINAPVCGVKF